MVYAKQFKMENKDAWKEMKKSKRKASKVEVIEKKARRDTEMEISKL